MKRNFGPAPVGCPEPIDKVTARICWYIWWLTQRAFDVNLDPPHYELRHNASPISRQGCVMSLVSDRIGRSLGYGRGRKVSVERDGTDFVVAFQPEGHVIFRHHDLKALRNVCSKLR